MYFVIISCCVQHNTDVPFMCKTHKNILQSYIARFYQCTFRFPLVSGGHTIAVIGDWQSVQHFTLRAKKIQNQTDSNKYLYHG